MVKLRLSPGIRCECQHRQQIPCHERAHQLFEIHPHLRLWLSKRCVKRARRIGLRVKLAGDWPFKWSAW